MHSLCNSRIGGQYQCPNGNSISCGFNNSFSPSSRSQNCCQYQCPNSNDLISNNVSDQDFAFFETDNCYQDDYLNDIDQEYANSQCYSSNYLDNYDFSLMDDKENDDQECLKSSYNQSKVNSTIQNFENSLMGIIRSQEFDGRWSRSLFESLKHFINSSCGSQCSEKIEKYINENKKGIDNDKINDLKSTIFSLCILKKLFSKNQSIWKLIETKAVNWLNSIQQNQGEKSITELVSTL